MNNQCFKSQINHQELQTITQISQIYYKTMINNRILHTQKILYIY